MLEYLPEKKKWENYLSEFVKNVENDGLDRETAIMYGNIWLNIETVGCAYGKLDQEIKKFIPTNFRV